MKEIKVVVPDPGEIISADIDKLHEELLKLPAGMYVDLYHMMSRKIDGSHFVLNGLMSANSACCMR